MNLKQLEYFVKVAELGSFSKAALVLNIAQPALSRQVRALETDLHENLLLRTGRGVVLTEAGKRLFEHSVGILQLVTRAREDIDEGRDAPVGRIVIGLPPSAGRALTLPLIDAFKHQLPRAKLAIVEGLTAHIAEWIATGRVDVGLVYNPDASTAIETIPVREEALCLVGPAAQSPSATRGRRRAETNGVVPVRDLPAFPLIVPERTHAIRKLVETQAALANIKLEVAFEVSSVQSILELVREGYGYAVLSESALAASGQAEAFSRRLLTEPPLTTTLFVAVSAHKPSTPLVKHAMRLLKELVAGVPGSRALRQGRRTN